MVGWEMTLKELALRMRCSRCGKKAAEVVAVALGFVVVRLIGQCHLPDGVTADMKPQTAAIRPLNQIFHLFGLHWFAAQEAYVASAWTSPHDPSDFTW